MSAAETPKVSVIVPVKNASDVLAQQLAALAAQVGAPDFETVICDNGSTDSSLGVVEAWKGRVPGLRVVDASDRPGAAHARNVGIRAAKAPVLAFCDADDIVAPDWVQQMADAARPGVVLRGWIDFRLLNSPDWYSGDGIETEVVPMLGYLPGIGSGNVGMMRDDALAVGGFDESYRWGVEDIDFAWRAQQMDMTVEPVPAAINCRLRGAPKAVFRQQRTYGRGNIMLRVRHAEHLGNVMSFRYSAKALLGELGATLRQLVTKRRISREQARRVGAAIGEFEGHLMFRVGKVPAPILMPKP